MPCHRLLVGLRANRPPVGLRPRCGSKQERAFDPPSGLPAGALPIGQSQWRFIVFVIGIDPHKGSHTAAVLDRDEQLVGELRVRASSCSLRRRVAGRWRRGSSRRCWAIEGATGTGVLLAQQLVAAGETVLDVPPTLFSSGSPARQCTRRQDRRPRRPLRHSGRVAPLAVTSRGARGSLGGAATAHFRRSSSANHLQTNAPAPLGIRLTVTVIAHGEKYPKLLVSGTQFDSASSAITAGVGLLTRRFRVRVSGGPRSRCRWPAGHERRRSPGRPAGSADGYAVDELCDLVGSVAA